MTEVWPVLKKALWDVVMEEEINRGYVAAFPFVEKLYEAALAAIKNPVVFDQQGEADLESPTDKGKWLENFRKSVAASDLTNVALAPLFAMTKVAEDEEKRYSHAKSGVRVNVSYPDGVAGSVKALRDRADKYFKAKDDAACNELLFAADALEHFSTLSTKLQEPVGETQSVEEVVCATCSRHIMTDPQPATGWLAACGNRLTRIDECKNSNGCSVQSSLNRAFVEDCLRNYAALIIDGRIDGAGHYLHEDIIEQADIIQVEPSLEKAKDALEAIDAEYSITGQCKELLDEALATLAHQPAKAGWVATHRHVKRGSEYEHIGTGRIQSDTPLKDMEYVEIYLGREGDLWARKHSEFHDGRFAALKSEGRNDG